MISLASKFYITTAIPYVNAAPHLGHALEFIQTDVIARYYKLCGKDSFLTTGADENSLKNVHAAEAKDITPAQLCKENAAVFKKLADKTGLSYTSFIRSSIKEEHWAGPEKLWKLCEKAGDIYKKKYQGLYCVGCESFYELEELPNGLCPEHQKKPELVEEENYFFRLSKYQKQLEQLIESDKLKIIPESRKNEVLSFIRSGLKDFSISRSVARAKGWGVPVPSSQSPVSSLATHDSKLRTQDSEQIMYVWVDALSVYITGVGYGFDEKKFKKYWPCDVHVIGKGIIRFHAVYWPAILLSAGIKPPKALLVHGYITVEGQKMSKSLGNIVDPFYLIEKYGVDELRYCLLSEISTFEDGDFSERVLIEKNNNELLANLGNLVNRTLVFIKNNFDGKIPKGKLDEKDKVSIESNKKAHSKIAQLLGELKLKDAINEIMLISKETNKYFQDNAPWQLVKTDKERAGAVLYTLVNQVKDLAILIWPFLPKTSEEIFKQLNIEQKKWDDLGKQSIKPDHKIGEPKVLFRRLELNKQVLDETFSKKVSFSDLDIEVGEIISASQHPNAEKLLVEKVKLSNGEIQLVSGVAKFYKPEELVGKKILVLRNIPSAKLRGVESQGMLLVCESASGEIEVINPNADVGTKVTVEDQKLQAKSQKLMAIENFFKIKLEVKDNIAYAEGKALFAGNEKLKTKKIKDGKIT